MRLYVSHDLGLSGAPRLLVDTYKALHRDGDLLIAKRTGPLADELTAKGCRFHVSDTSHELMVTYHRAHAFAVDLLRQLKPEVVYANTVGSVEWIVAAAELGIPALLHVHELENVRREFQQIGHYSLEKHVSADLTLCASDRILVQLQQDGLPAGKLMTVGVAIDERRVLAESAKRADEHRPYFAWRDTRREPGRRTYCMIGSGCHRKGFDIFFDVASKSPETDFVWVGGLMREAPMQRLAERLKQQPANFHQTGWLINPFPILADCDGLILTAREDPNPLVVYEALALGKKVLCFAGTGDSHIKVRDHYPVMAGLPSTARIIAALDILNGLPAHTRQANSDPFAAFLRTIEGALSRMSRAAAA